MLRSSVHTFSEIGSVTKHPVPNLDNHWNTFRILIGFGHGRPARALRALKDMGGPAPRSAGSWSWLMLMAHGHALIRSWFMRSSEIDPML